MPDIVTGSRGSGRASGKSTRGPFASYDRVTSSWRMLPTSSPTASTSFSGTWPTSGTMQNGVCSAQTMWAHHISAIASGLSPAAPSVLPTTTPYAICATNPTAHDTTSTTPTVPVLAQIPARWPTPMARDGKGGYVGGRIRNGKVSWDQLDVAVQYTSNQHKTGGPLNPRWVEWLMGYPVGWLSCVVSATPSSRTVQRSPTGTSSPSNTNATEHAHDGV